MSQSVDYKTSLYNQDADSGRLYRLLPETTADQVKMTDGGDVETLLVDLSSAADELRSSVTQTGLDVAEAQAALVQTNATVSTLSGRVDGLDSGVSTLSAGLESLTDRLDDTIDSTAESIEAAQGDIAQTSAAVTAMSTALTAVQQTADSALSSVQSLSVFTGATLSDAGETGFVPAPDAGGAARFLNSSGSWINPENLDTTHVLKAGDSMSGQLEIVKAGPISHIKLKNTLETLGSPTGQGISISFVDNADNEVAKLEYGHFSSGSTQFDLIVHGQDGSVAKIGVGVDVNGSKFSYGVTPPLSSNNAFLSTTAWVNQKLGSAASLAVLNVGIETFETRKQEAIAQVNAEAQAAIYMGFPYEVDGQEYRVGYSLFDQVNLSSLAIVALQNPGKSVAFPCMDEMGRNVWLDVPTETVLAIHRYGVIFHADVIRKAAEEKKSLIMAAQIEEELQALI